MSRHAARARSGSDRTSLYDEITDKIIAELEAGRVPWVQPWGTAAAKAPLAMPKNAATGRRYSGINVLILWGAVIEHGFPARAGSPFARRSRSAAMSARASTAPPSSMPTASFPTTRRSGRARPARKRRRSRSSSASPSSTWRNAKACRRISRSPRRRRSPGLIEPKVEALIKATGIDFRIGGSRAFYMPAHDYRAGPAAASLFRADQLAPHGAA